MSEKKQRYALTHPQQRVWYTEKLHPGTGMWNNAGTLKIKGKLDYALLERAVNLFLRDNESARLRIGTEDGVPYQYISEYEPVSIELIDFTQLGKKLLYEWDGEQTQIPMQLVGSSLYYFAMMKLSEHEGWLYFKFHHIISDGLSLVGFCNRVMEHYQGLLKGIEEPEEETAGKPHSYTEYIHEEEEYLRSQRFSDDQQYWINNFEQLPEPTVIKQKTTNYFSTKARRMSFIIPSDLTSEIKSFCAAAGISVFTLFMSALAVHINRITGKKDIVIGTPVANKTSSRAKDSFGMRVSTVPFRIEVNDELPFNDFVQQVSDRWISALKHQKYPYDILLQKLRSLHKGLESLYDVTLNFQIGTFEKDAEQFTYEARWHFSGYQANSLSIHINDRENSGKFIVDYDHQIPYYNDKEIEYFHAHMMNLLMDIISHPEKPLYMLEIMSDEESDRIMNRFNDTDYAFPKSETLVDLWNKQLKNMPSDNIAVICGEKSMSYAELDSRSSVLAVHLKKYGVIRDSIVGLLVKRNFDYCIGVLAILKAGGAFLPIDAELPGERIAYMLSDSGAKVLLIAPGLENRCPGGSIPVVKTDTPHALSDVSVLTDCSPGSLAYVIYTSGSTGQPKGVQIEHHSAVHFVYSLNEIWDFSRGARFLCASSISFDMSVAELLLAFMNGAMLVLAQENEVNIPENMARLIDTAKVNMMIVTPGRMELLLSDKKGADCIREFREIGMGGDVLGEKLLAKVQELTHARIFNLYGPTEITACATYVDVTNVKIPNIGRPMPDVKIYILDKYKNPLPIGVPGEIYIGGPGVARGYINKPELTSKNFIDSPFCPGQKLYRTGDLARWYPHGDIEFLGRIDKQVKIRGYRVELGEIEARLMQVPGVTACAVADRTDAAGHKYLCAYLCGNPPKKSDIKAQLTRDMPSYMIPLYFMFIDSLPFNASGKVDRGKLPDLLLQQITNEDYVPPETATEQILAGIWESILNTEKIGRYDSFFDAGGDSLSIVAAMAQVMQEFHVDISLEDVYRSPRLTDVAALIDAAAQINYRPILTSPAMDDYPVSSAQQRMWVLTQGERDSVAYNIPLAFSMKGKLDIPRLESAFNILIKSHDALRTSFILKDGELRQRVNPEALLELERLQCESTDLQGMLKGLIRPFDLKSAPLMRVAVIKKGEDDYILFIDMHHIIGDARTTEILFKDLADIYAGNPVNKKGVEYRDYSLWQQGFFESENVLHQRDYWKEELSGELPLLNLHTDRPRPSVQQFKGARFEFTVGKEILEKLRSFAKQKDSTTFMIILAAYNVLLSKYTGQEDIIIGAPVSGRNREETKDIAGVFLNTVPLRNFPKGELKFSEFFDALRKKTAAAFAHSDYPLERIIADLSLPRDASRNPLFDTILAYSKGIFELKLNGLKCRLYPFDPGVAKFDLTLEVFEQADELVCMFEYNTQLLYEATIKRMSAHLCRLFEILIDDPQARLSDVSMMTQDELNQVIYDFNRTDVPLESGLTIQEVFERIADQFPDKTALIADDGKLSFRELNQRANRIAYRLRECGVGRNTVVSLCMRRSLSLISGLLSVLKAGGGYLPIDPTYPSERILFMLKDSGCTILLTDGVIETESPGPKICIQDIPDEGPCDNLIPVDQKEDVGYVIYTSGSTGTPKGASLPRRGMINLYETAKTAIAYQPEETSVSVTTVSFDIFIGDALLPLLFGCTVVLCNEEQLRQPHLLAELILETKSSFIQTTPTRMRIMMDNPAFRTAAAQYIRKIVLGGEIIPESLLKLLKEYIPAQIINGYGPTEATVYASFKDLTHTSFVTIGKPAANTRFYILDRNMHPTPVGVLGEAYISGEGVATGYINRAEMNRERFILDPYWPGHMMYRTGDVCAFLPDGDIEMVGRVDHQVKIRGLRIELGEIEATMRAIKGVREAVVMDWGEGADKYLCAYYTMSENVDPETIRQTLIRRLPAYMVPSYFIEMDELPMTPNGKVNRKALLEPDRATMQKKPAALEDMTETEKKMAQVWSMILNIDPIGPDDSFFTLGGDSLGVIKVQTAILQYGWTILTRDFYELQTLRAVCGCINRDTKKSITSAHEKVKERNIPQYSHLKKARLKNVLLTGATGFLGAQILGVLARDPEAHIYCLVRGKDKSACGKYLREVLRFYFDDKCSGIMKQVTVLKGDITAPGFGISGKQASLIDIDTVIHSAALTDHFGSQEIFNKINVQGTRNAIELAKAAGAALLHVSTSSVAGTYYTYDTGLKGEFTENSFYAGQNFADNEYVKSKFLAEEAVLDAIAGGLNARIMRVGLLTGTLGGRFQMRPEKNAFANRIKALCSVGCVPLGMLGERFEMTPADTCAQAILSLAEVESKQPVYHVFNDAVSLGEVIALLEQNGIMFEVVSDNEFMSRMKSLSMQGELSDLAGLMTDLDNLGASNIIITGNITKQELARQGFSWPAIDAEYMKLFLNSINKSPEKEKYI